MVLQQTMQRTVFLLIGLYCATSCNGAWASAVRNLDEKLQLAVRRGDLTNGRELLETGANVNARDEYGATPLHHASASGNLEIVRLLVAHNAIIGAVCEFGDTPLHDAAEKGHLHVVQFLVQKGADINSGGSTLRTAIKNNHPKLVEWLLENNASFLNPSLFHFANDTPLHLAAMYGHLEIVQLLVEKGGGTTDTSPFDKPPLHTAAEYGHLQAVQWLAERAAGDLNKESLTYGALINAARGGHLDIVKWLEQHGVNLKDTFGSYKALIAAAHGGHLDVVKWLVLKGAPVDVGVLVNNETPLDAARNKDHQHVVELLESPEDVRPLLCVGEWRPHNHHLYPRSYRRIMRTLVILARAGTQRTTDSTDEVVITSQYPQSCLDLLPEELLQYVFAYISAPTLPEQVENSSWCCIS